jgi:hypothetical protein
VYQSELLGDRGSLWKAIMTFDRGYDFGGAFCVRDSIVLDFFCIWGLMFCFVIDNMFIFDIKLPSYVIYLIHPNALKGSLQ